MPQFQGSLGPFQDLTDNPNPEAAPQEKTGVVSNSRADCPCRLCRKERRRMSDQPHPFRSFRVLLLALGGTAVWLFGMAWLAS